MRSDEAVVGKKVQVLPQHRRAEFRGVYGTIRQRYGAPDYLALDVEFGDGRSVLFWHYELEEVDDSPVLDRR
jgi:hypothetical protein